MTVTTRSGQRWERQAAKSIRVTAVMRMRAQPLSQCHSPYQSLGPLSNPQAPVSLNLRVTHVSIANVAPFFSRPALLSSSQREKALKAVTVRSPNTGPGMPRMLRALAHRMGSPGHTMVFHVPGPLHTLLPHSLSLSLVPYNLGKGSPPQTMGPAPLTWAGL